MTERESGSYLSSSGDTDEEGSAGASKESGFYMFDSYQIQMNLAQERHTGSRDAYLAAWQEQELAESIQDGLAARAELQDQPSSPEVLGELQARIDEGRAAEEVLIESNLKIGQYLALASMGLRQHIPQYERQSWNPQRLGQLKTPGSELDDRIQTANLGLVKAARGYKPGIIGTNGELTRFLSYAVPVITTELARLARQHENLIHFPDNIVLDIIHAHSPNWQVYLTAEQREDSIKLSRLQETTPLDTLYLETDPETNPSDTPDAGLPASEVIPATWSDQTAEEVIGAMRQRELSEGLEAVLGQLNERWADIIRRRFGLGKYQEPATLDEIAEADGISHQAVSRMIGRVLNKLRELTADDRTLAEFLTDDEPEMVPPRTGGTIRLQSRLGRVSLHASR